MNKRKILWWTGLLLAGPIVGVGGIVLYERDIARDTAGLLAGVGWIFTAVVAAWLAVKVMRGLPVRYSLWAMAAAIPVAVVAAGIHGLVYALFEVEEPLFFLLAIFGAPLMFFAGLIGWLTQRRGDHTGGAPTGTGMTGVAHG